MNAEWWEIAIVTLSFATIVWIKESIEDRRLTKYVLRRVIEMWLTGQGPPSLYNIPDQHLPTPPKTE